MRKRIALLTIGMVLSLLMVGIAIAVSYFNASPSVGTVTTDGCFLLTMSGDTATEISLEESAPSWYKIQLDIERSDDEEAVAALGKLDLKLSPSTGFTVDGVTVEVYENKDDLSPKASLSGLSTGSAIATVSNISTSTTVYWLKVTLSSGHTADQLAKIGGNLNLVFSMQ